MSADDSITVGELVHAYSERIAHLEAELAEEAALSDRMADILKRTANALKGEPEPLSSHSWHDLPEIAAAMRPVVECCLQEADEHGGCGCYICQTVDAYRAQREGK